ncbi:hypothetical protein K505DRAFT_323178, partial [Melanomma pulvis-pyrius CBS 109.77]
MLRLGWRVFLLAVLFTFDLTLGRPPWDYEFLLCHPLGIIIEDSGFDLKMLPRVVRVGEAPVGVWIIMGRRIF